MKTLLNFINKRQNTLRNLCILSSLLYLIEEVIFHHPHLNYVLDVYKGAGEAPFLTTLAAVASIILSFFIMVIFLYGLSTSPAWLKSIYIVIFTCSAVGEYAYQKGFQRFARVSDIEIGVTTPNHIWVDALKLYVDWKVVFPIALLAIVLWGIKSKPNLKLGIISISTIIMMMVFENYIINNTAYALDLGPSPVQGFTIGIDFLLQKMNSVKRETIGFHIVGIPKNNIILIIDESLRGDHLSVNGYYRATTPHLEALSQEANLFHNWGIAVPGATCSNTSNGLLITGALIEKGSLRNISSYPTLFQYAKAMGYRTTYIDAQTHQLWNGLNVNDLIYLDNRISDLDLKGKENQEDIRAAIKVNEILKEGGGNFIILNKHGVHFIYENDYPRWATIWSPVPETTTDFESQVELTINSYDNAIRFNVDSFFEQLFPDPDRLAQYTKNNIYIYTSDHADTLYENGATSSHCSGTKQETQVPLIIIGHLPNEVDTKYLASHSNIFPTILDLMAVPVETRTHEYNISLLKAQEGDSQARLFFNSDGTIVNHDNLP